jgi:hypothetical protein
VVREACEGMNVNVRWDVRPIVSWTRTLSRRLESSRLRCGFARIPQPVDLAAAVPGICRARPLLMDHSSPTQVISATRRGDHVLAWTITSVTGVVVGTIAGLQQHNTIRLEAIVIILAVIALAIVSLSKLLQTPTHTQTTLIVSRSPISRRSSHPM